MERVGRRESFPCIFLIVAFIFTSNQQGERAIFCIVDSGRYACEPGRQAVRDTRLTSGIRIDGTVTRARLKAGLS